MRILVIEDEKELSRFLKSSLEAECFVVDIAQDGERGSYLARTNDYDLIILDLILPRLSGKEVCREIRKKKKNLPIIILSVKSSIPSKTELFDLGVDDYLTKPFSFEELLARIKAVLRRPPLVKEQVLKASDLTVNLKKQTIKRGSKEIYLTRKEFMLLELLAKNKDEVVSRASIIEHVWDMNADFLSNTIESHIRRLRKKIDQRGKKKLIKTIPGRGYKLES